MAEENLINEEEFIDEAIEGVIEGLGEVGIAGEDVIGRIRRGGRKGLRNRFRKRFKPRMNRAARVQRRRGQTSVTAATSLTENVTTKGYFEFKKKELPEDIKKGLASGSLQFVDSTVYVTKDAKGLNNLKMFSSADNDTVGLSNITGAKLPKGQFFLLTGISLDYASRQSSTDLNSAKFDDNYPPALEAGVIDKLIAGDEILLKDFPIANFPEGSNVTKNHFIKLENPKWIKEQENIELDIDTPSALANDATADAEDFATVRIRLHGGMVTKK